MALNDDAVLLPGTGHVLTATVGATKPALADLTSFAADTTDLPTGFTDLGHTSIDDIITFGQDGGDSEVKGSWQNPSLREVVTAQAVDFFTIPSLQVLDNEVLTLYYGGGSIAVANEFQLPDSPVPQEKAVAVIFLDGVIPVCFYVPKASIRRDDAIDASTDDFMSLPLRFTLVKASGQPRAIWIADDLGA